MVRRWLILAAVSLVLGTAIMIGVRMQPARASSPPLVQLTSIGPSHVSYHRGDSILLWANYYNSSGYQLWVALHPAVYHSSYRLLNISTGISTQPYVDVQESSWSVTIPKNAPLGTYKYWLTLSESGYPNQTLLTSFTVVK
jgi:hypothetical protein